MAPALREALSRMLRDPDQSIRMVRDRALLLVGFAGVLRRSERVGLRWTEVTFSDAGLRLHLRRSKIDQEGRGRTFEIPPARTPGLCPVAALLAWRESLTRQKGALPPEAPVFRAVDRHGRIADKALTDVSVALIVKERCRKAGLDPANFVGHSLRAGFCCVFHAHSATDSTLIRPPVPRVSGH